MHAVATASRPDIMSAANAHSSVTQGDLELLDALTAMPSSFPHHAQFAPSASASRPLSTLNALRRPPIDPMVLAASLSSGPHVTRHHFHHSFGNHDPASKSQQMPASQRKAAAAAAAAAYETRTLDAVALLLSLYEQERLLEPHGSSAYRLAALNYNAFRRPEGAVRYALLALEQFVVEEGANSAGVREMVALMDDPEAHWSWGKRL